MYFYHNSAAVKEKAFLAAILTLNKAMSTLISKISHQSREFNRSVHKAQIYSGELKTVKPGISFPAKKNQKKRLKTLLHLFEKNQKSEERLVCHNIGTHCSPITLSIGVASFSLPHGRQYL